MIAPEGPMFERLTASCPSGCYGHSAVNHVFFFEWVGAPTDPCDRKISMNSEPRIRAIRTPCEHSARGRLPVPHGSNRAAS